MNDVGWRRAIVPGVLIAMLLVRSIIPGSDPARTIGLVFCEALVLYVGYGAVIRTTSPTVYAFLARA